MRTWNKIDAGARCRLVGRIKTLHGLVCSTHNRCGFIPFVAEPVDESIAMRMRAVCGE